MQAYDGRLAHPEDVSGSRRFAPSPCPGEECESASAHEFDPRQGRGPLLCPSKGLRCGVDLIIVFAIGEGGEFVKVLGQPVRFPREVDEAVFDGAGLGMHSHYLVVFGFITGDSVDPLLEKLLDQLSAGGLVLDQDDARLERLPLLAHRTLEIRIPHPFAQDVEQVDAFLLDPPGRADTVVAQFARLVRGISR
jgi:hypothetical protein